VAVGGGVEKDRLSARRRLGANAPVGSYPAQGLLLPLCPRSPKGEDMAASERLAGATARGDGVSASTADIRHSEYARKFYSERRHNTLYAARTILEHVFTIAGDIQSVVDIGCGTGTWLTAATENGARQIVGVEGPWLDRSLLEIDSDCLVVTDLEQPISLPRRFDLAVSLEVAEHLSASRASSFVHDLCAASDLVLFSAAVPAQGGKHHINERFPSYWAQLFEEKDYLLFDCVRGPIWQDRRIPFWYRQNTLLFARQHSLPAQRVSAAHARQRAMPLLDCIHPELFARAQLAPLGVRAATRNLARALARKLSLSRGSA
jgi:SAM-dependent methyltransferase